MSQIKMNELILNEIAETIGHYHSNQYDLINNKRDLTYDDFDLMVRDYYKKIKIYSKNIGSHDYVNFLSFNDINIRTLILILIKDSFYLYDYNVELFEKIVLISVDGADDERVIVNSIIDECVKELYNNCLSQLIYKNFLNYKYDFDYYSFLNLYALLCKFDDKKLIGNLMSIGERSNSLEVKEAYEQVLELK